MIGVDNNKIIYDIYKLNKNCLNLKISKKSSKIKNLKEIFLALMLIIYFLTQVLI